MTTYYFNTDPNTALNNIWMWFYSPDRRGMFWVSASSMWAVSSYAVMDDFGDLVAVP